MCIYYIFVSCQQWLIEISVSEEKSSLISLPFLILPFFRFLLSYSFLLFLLILPLSRYPMLMNNLDGSQFKSRLKTHDLLDSNEYLLRGKYNSLLCSLKKQAGVNLIRWTLPESRKYCILRSSLRLVRVDRTLLRIHANFHVRHRNSW